MVPRNEFQTLICSIFFFFFQQKTAYEILRSDWGSDVCSSDLRRGDASRARRAARRAGRGLRGAGGPRPEIGRASCRERVWQYVSISVVAVSLKKKKKKIIKDKYTPIQTNTKDNNLQ